MSKAFPKRAVGRRTRGAHPVGIAYDGQVTEEIYFRGWAQVLGQSKLDIRPVYVRSGGNPLMAVQEAIKWKRNNPELSEVWCVTDVDGAPTQTVAQARSLALNGGVELCISDRCFEIWLHCHFGKSGKRVMNEDEAVKLLKGHVTEYSDKNKRIEFSQLLPRTSLAIANAQWLRARNLGNPSTDVDLLAARLLKKLPTS